MTTNIIVPVVLTAVVLSAVMLAAIVSIYRDWNEKKFPPPTSFDLGTWDEEN